MKKRAETSGSIMADYISALANSSLSASRLNLQSCGSSLLSLTTPQLRSAL